MQDGAGQVEHAALRRKRQPVERGGAAATMSATEADAPAARRAASA